MQLEDGGTDATASGRRGRSKAWKLGAIAIAAIGFVGGGVAGAAITGQNPSGPARLAPDFIFRGKGIDRVMAVTSAANNTITSTAEVQLPGMVTVINVPVGRKATLIARFSAESACYGGGVQPNWCIARILVDGTEAEPATANDFAFDSTDNGAETAFSWESHAMERLISVGEGRHTISVVGSVTDFGATAEQVFWTGERALVVETSLT